MRVRARKNNREFEAEIFPDRRDDKPVSLNGKYFRVDRFLKEYCIIEMSDSEKESLMGAFKSPLEYYRKYCHKTQTSLGKISSVPQSFISKYERGVLPSSENLEKLKDALEIPDEEFTKNVMSYWLKNYLEPFFSEHGCRALHNHIIVIEEDETSPKPFSAKVKIIPSKKFSNKDRTSMLGDN